MSDVHVYAQQQFSHYTSSRIQFIQTHDRWRCTNNENSDKL